MLCLAGSKILHIVVSWKHILRLQKLIKKCSSFLIYKIADIKHRNISYSYSCFFRLNTVSFQRLRYPRLVSFCPSLASPSILIAELLSTIQIN